jgi:hypothetical protein
MVVAAAAMAGRGILTITGWALRSTGTLVAGVVSGGLSSGVIGLVLAIEETIVVCVWVDFAVASFHLLGRYAVGVTLTAGTGTIA